MALVLILLILISIFIIALVLLQPSKGNMGSAFGGMSQMGEMFGVTKTKNILATATKIAAVVVLVLILATNKFLVGGNMAEVAPEKKIITEGVNPNMFAPPAQAPSAPAPKK